MHIVYIRAFEEAKNQSGQQDRTLGITRHQSNSIIEANVKTEHTSRLLGSGVRYPGFLIE